MNAIAVFNPKICSSISGTVKFHQCSVHRKTLVEFNISGLKSNGVNAVHIHKYGISNTETPCESTCDHYNPYNKSHGNIILHGTDRHAGDLINNMYADKNGNFQFSYEDDLIQVGDILGRSVIIHNDADDLGRNREFDKGSATTGNAGKRIACAVIGLLGKY